MTTNPPPGSDLKTSRNEERLYIHESVVISVAHRKAYLQHFTDVWGPRSRELYGMRCFGVWATSGSTGPWPEAIVMWELEGSHHLTGMMTGEFDFLKDPVSEAADHFEQFWATAPAGVVPTSGFDRLLIASATSRPIEELVAAGVRGEGYYHQIVTVGPGDGPEYLALCEGELAPVVETYGPQLVGAYRTILRSEDEVLLLWALPTWSAWEPFEGQLRDDVRLDSFRRASRSLGARSVAKLLVGAPGSPMEIGHLL